MRGKRPPPLRAVLALGPLGLPAPAGARAGRFQEPSQGGQFVELARAGRVYFHRPLLLDLDCTIRTAPPGADARRSPSPQVWLTKRRFQVCPDDHTIDMDRLCSIVRSGSPARPSSRQRRAPRVAFGRNWPCHCASV